MSRPSLAAIALLTCLSLAPAAALAQEGPKPGGRTCDMVELYNSQGRQAELEAGRRQLQAAQSSAQATERSLRNAGQPGAAEAWRAQGISLGQAIAALGAEIQKEQAKQAAIRARWNIACQPSAAPRFVAMQPFTVGRPEGYVGQSVPVPGQMTLASPLALGIRGAPPPANLGAYATVNPRTIETPLFDPPSEGFAPRTIPTAPARGPSMR